MKTNFNSFVLKLFAAAAGILIVLSLVVKKGEDVLWINGNHSEFSDFLFSVITHLGNGVFFMPVLAFLLFVEFRLCVMSVAIWLSHGLVCVLLKKGLFGHLKRPKSLIDNDLLYFVPHVDVPSHFSFPSGHATTAFCLALLLSLLSKSRPASAFLLLLAILVGYSRVYLLQHFLMDIAAGAAIGIGVTYFWWQLFERINLPPWMNKSLKLNRNRQLLPAGSK